MNLARKNPVGRPESINWQKWGKFAGTIPDGHLAKLIGCSAFAVLRYRRHNNIRAYQPKWGSETKV